MVVYASLLCVCYLLLYAHAALMKANKPETVQSWK